MADKTIQELPEATSVQLNDLFVLEQNGAAMRLYGQTLVNDLAAALDGHGNINNITYTPPEYPSLDGTLTFTMADDTVFTFDVTNGRGIADITWTASGTPGDGMIHTGTVLYNDGTTSTIQFQDGIQGLQGVQTYVWIMWAQDYPSADTDMQNTPADYIGIYSGTASTAPTSYEAYTWYDYKGDRGEPGDYIEPVVSYGTSTAASTEPSTWYSSPTSISYTAGNFIWRKTQYVLHDEQTVQATATEIIGYIGQNGSGSGTVTQITVNGTVYSDDGTGNVSMNLDPEDVGAIADPSTKSNGQVLTYDSVADEWVAATPSTGSVNTVNNVGPTAGTTNVQLYATAIPMSSSDNRSVANAMPGPSDVAAKPLGTAAAGTNALFSRADHIHPMPSASDVGAVSTNDVQFKIYDSVNDLGLTSGSATIAGALTALPENGILICAAGGFSSSEVPNIYGTIELKKRATNRPVIQFFGRSEDNGDWRMFCDANGTPSGTWIKVANVSQNVTFTAASILSNVSTTFKRTGQVVSLSLVADISSVSAGTWTTIGTIPSAVRPSSTVSGVCMMAYVAAQFQITTGGNVQIRRGDSASSTGVRFNATWIL